MLYETLSMVGIYWIQRKTNEKAAKKSQNINDN